MHPPQNAPVNMALKYTVFESDGRNTRFDIFLCLADLSFWIKRRKAPTVPSPNISILHLWRLYLFGLHQSSSSGRVAEVESPGNPKPHTWINTIFVHWKAIPPVYFYLVYFCGWQRFSSFFFFFFNWRALEFKWFLIKPLMCLERLAPGRC